MRVHRESVVVGGRRIEFETGRMARQAGGSCLVRLDDTLVLVTVVAQDEPRPGMSFFPLTVEYRDRFAAVGRIPPWQNRREARPSDREVLLSRVTDRSIRPLFPDGFRCEVQVAATVLSAEPEVDPGDIALLGASLSLQLSDVPWEGPVAGGRFVRKNGRVIAFPRASDSQDADLDLFVSVGPQGLLMVEGEANEAPEAEVVETLVAAEEMLRPLLDVQRRLRKAAGQPKRPEPTAEAAELPAEVREAAEPHRARFETALLTPEKKARGRALRAAEAEAAEELAARLPDTASEDLSEALGRLRRDVARGLIASGRRFDGRGLRDVRPISTEAGLLPRSHGSALFTRGETQALATATLGSGSDQLRVAGLHGDAKQRFFLHYNFPSFSVGEVRPMRGPGRREIGHGNLAMRALQSAIPAEDGFPYTIRIVSDILESNGSSSMATVCAGCLALMDAGVPIRRPVAGVAMGLVAEKGEVAVLTDILGDEDHLGDMDFKVCGTAQGITALQMDIKMEGLDAALLGRAMDQAREARLHILGEMAKTLAAPRPELSERAPRLLSIRVRPEQIRIIIGPGGSTIRGISEETGASVDINDDGLVRVAAVDAAAARAALGRVEELVQEAEVGAVYGAIAKTVRDKVAFVELFPGTEGVLPIAEVAHERIERVSDYVRQGEVVNVRVLGVDRGGKIRVSRRAALDADPTEVRVHRSRNALP